MCNFKLRIVVRPDCLFVCYLFTKLLTRSQWIILGHSFRQKKNCFIVYLYTKQNVCCCDCGNVLKSLTHNFLFTPHRTSMSGSMARIPIHRCSSTSILRPRTSLEPILRPRPVSEINLANVWCDCPDTLLNYMPHKLCLKSNLYRIVDNYLFYHPSLVKSASYI